MSLFSFLPGSIPFVLVLELCLDHVKGSLVGLVRLLKNPKCIRLSEPVPYFWTHP